MTRCIAPFHQLHPNSTTPSVLLLSCSFSCHMIESQGTKWKAASGSFSQAIHTQLVNSLAHWEQSPNRWESKHPDWLLNCIDTEVKSWHPCLLSEITAQCELEPKHGSSGVYLWCHKVRTGTASINVSYQPYKSIIKLFYFITQSLLITACLHASCICCKIPERESSFAYF